MNITLRPINLNDTDNIIKWRNTTFVLKQFIDQRPLDKQIHLNWYNKYILTNKAIQFIIVYNNIDIGSIFIKDINLINKSGELGIFIGEQQYTGKKIGQQAIKLISNYVFKNYNIDYIISRIKDTNISSIKAFEKVNYKQTHKIDNIIFMKIKKEEL